MSYAGAPTSVRSLEQRIRSLEGSDGLSLRSRVGMALVVVGQMLPEGAIKGGSAMALRFGRGTRFTQDLDAARVQPLARYQLADDLVQLFTEVGLEAPKPVRVMRADHQIAQKLHAVSADGSERARDLVDLQLLDKGEDLDLLEVTATCIRLFDYRRQQAWPPPIAAGSAWEMLYAEAAEDLDLLPTVDDATAWANDFVRRIADAQG